MVERGILGALFRAPFSAFAALGKGGIQEDAIPKERQVEIKRFSKEANEALGREGYIIYELNGVSIRDLKDAGKKFTLPWHENEPDFEALRSRRSEVAINPNPKKLFIPDSNNKTLAVQKKMVEEFSRKLSGKIKGVEAVIGGAADYVELAFIHLREKEIRLFGEMNDWEYARTVTFIDDTNVADVGNHDEDQGLCVYQCDSHLGDQYVSAAPLVVPK